MIENQNNITNLIQSHIREPGANRESLSRFLVEEVDFTPEDGQALASAVCRKMTEERFPAVTEMELMLTEDCNLRCDYCFVEGKNPSHPMSRATARKAVDFLFELSRDKPELKILFFGGEPMLSFELIEKIVLYVEEKEEITGKKVAFDMTTNGTLFKEERAEFLAEHRVKYLLSIDGDRETHDRHRHAIAGQSSYLKIISDLPLLKKYQPWMGARMTVHPDTVEKIYENVVHLAGLGFNQFLIGPATGLEWNDRGLDTYRDQMILVAGWLKSKRDQGSHYRINTLEESVAMMAGKKNFWGCRAGRHSITVTARETIFPCSKMLGVDNLEGICPLGTLDDGLTELYNRLSLCGLVSVDRQTCLDCRWADTCMGGCFATNYQATGSLFAPDPFECRLKPRTMAMARAAEEILGPEFFQD
ncbi:MAG: radical SAM protein [Candidatus Auribacterota bacterium]|nr:radical SAM protein [Candidatus Auribacterota bacterium]